MLNVYKPRLVFVYRNVYCLSRIKVFPAKSLPCMNNRISQKLIIGESCCLGVFLEWLAKKASYLFFSYGIAKLYYSDWNGFLMLGWHCDCNVQINVTNETCTSWRFYIMIRCAQSYHTHWPSAIPKQPFEKSSLNVLLSLRR